MILRTLLFILCLAASLNAEVVRFDVQSRTDFLAGKDFGSAGAYEKLSGKIYFAVDPSNSANQIIADIDKAPRNAAGGRARPPAGSHFPPPRGVGDACRWVRIASAPPSAEKTGQAIVWGTGS